jgi:ABC-type antimicrobial peptide transport system permease subunit
VSGVTGVAGTSVAPFTRAAPSALVHDADGPADDHPVQWRVVTENYFEVMCLRAVEGRGLSREDRNDPANSHLVISQSEATRLRPRTGSRTLLWDGARFPVVGVVPDIREQHAVPDDSTAAAMYLINMRTYQIRYLLVRTSNPPLVMLPRLRAAIRNFDQTIQVINTTTMPDLVSVAMAQERFEAALSTTFGAAALALATVGLFGLMTSVVFSRRREIAIRMAIGATPTDIRTLVFSHAAKVVGAGVACGLPAALLAAHAAQAIVAIPAPSLSDLLVVAGTLCAASAMATAVPLMRAGRETPARVFQD